MILTDFLGINTTSVWLDKDEISVKLRKQSILSEETFEIYTFP